MKAYKFIVILIVILIITAFWRQAAISAGISKKSPWKSEAEAGYLLTSGNTETQTANAKFNTAYESENWKHRFSAEGVYSSEKSSDTGKNEATAQKYRLLGQTNYKIDEFNSVFGLLTYEDDRFSGYAYQISIVAGYSRQIIKNDTMDLYAEIGPGYRVNKLEDDSASGIDETEVVGHAARRRLFYLEAQRIGRVFPDTDRGFGIGKHYHPVGDGIEIADQRSPGHEGLIYAQEYEQCAGGYR